MLDSLLDWWFARRVKREHQALPRIDWKGLLRGIQDDIGGYAVYLETRDDQFIPISGSDANEDADVIGIVLAWVREGVRPWEMEGPAQQLKERLSERRGLEAFVLLRRRVEPFAGFYVRVRPRIDVT